MNKLKRLCAAVVLTFILTTPISAGVMDCPVASPPPPAPTSSMTQSDTESPSGHMPTGPGVTTTGGESYAEVVWELLEGVLLLF